MPETNGHPIREPAVQSRLLHARFMKLAMLEVVSYRELSDIVKMDVRTGKGRGYLCTAARMALRTGVVLRAERGIGIARCDSEAVVGLMEADRNSIRRKAHRSIKKGEHVELDKLKNGSTGRFLAHMSQMQMLEFAAKETTTKKFAYEAEKTRKQLPLKEMLEALK